jgi:hypothetical protein
MTPVKKSKVRRAASREDARRILTALINGNHDVYEAYRKLYGLWCTNNSAVLELRPLFQISGAEPDGRLSITEEFRKEIVAISQTILPYFK